MTRRVRFGATALTLLVATVVVAPLPAAICQVAVEGCCPLMRGAANAFCHREGSVAAPMDCCKPKAAPAPSPAGENAGARLQQAQAPPGLGMLVTDSLPDAAPAERLAVPLRVAAARHALGVYALLQVFRV